MVPPGGVGTLISGSIVGGQSTPCARANLSLSASPVVAGEAKAMLPHSAAQDMAEQCIVRVGFRFAEVARKPPPGILGT